MRKLMSLAIAVALALALSAGTASARTGISWDDTVGAIVYARLEIIAALNLTITCPVTIDVTLHATVAKTAGSLMGFADLAIGTCSQNRAGLLSGRSRVTEIRGFHVTFVGFTGTLPSITSVTYQINDVTFWVSGGGIECLTEGAQDIATQSSGGNPATGSNISAGSVRFDGDFPCDFSSGTVTGVGTIDEAMGIRLI